LLFDFLPFDWLFVSLPSLNNEINSSLHRPVPLDPIMSTLVLLLHPVVARPRSKFIYKSLLAIWSFNVCGQTFCHYVIQIENYYLSAGRRTNCSCQNFFPLCISVELLFCSDEPSGVFFIWERLPCVIIRFAFQTRYFSLFLFFFRFTAISFLSNLLESLS